MSGNDTLTITRVELLLSRVELTQTIGAPCDDDAGTAGCAELEQHLVAIELPVDTTVRTALVAGVPPGTYSSLEARLRPARGSGDAAASQVSAAHPELSDGDVRVEGTFRGLPFTYVGNIDTRFELQFAPPLTVTDGGVNITIHVDVLSWFRDGSGRVIDPASATSGGSNTGLVRDNIQRSFRAVRDDERDGRDHGGDGPGHD